MIHYLKYCTL